MRARITIESIRCETSVLKVADALGPMKGINEARIEMGHSAVVIDFEDGMREKIEGALRGAGFDILSYEELAPLTA